MSFQDVGKRNSNRQPVNAAMGSTSSVTMGMPSASSASAATSSVFASMSISASTATSQISDSLTQYHRNVGILENISQSLLTNNGGRNRLELEQQCVQRLLYGRKPERGNMEQIVFRPLHARMQYFFLFTVSFFISFLFGCLCSCVCLHCIYKSYLSCLTLLPAMNSDSTLNKSSTTTGTRPNRTSCDNSNLASRNKSWDNGYVSKINRKRVRTNKHFSNWNVTLKRSKRASHTPNPRSRNK